MKVTFFQRKPISSFFSIERLFDDIRSCLPPDICYDLHICQYHSKGILPRIVDTIFAARHQGDVNHITGDVHFLSYFMNRQRTVLTIHDCVMLERSHGLRYLIFWFFWYWLPIKRASVVTVISESTKQAVLRHMRDGHLNIEVIPNCVSAEFRAVSFQFNSSCPRILQIGTKINKNLERVVIALQDLPCNLVIIGHMSQCQLDMLHEYDIDHENHANLTRSELVDQYIKADIVMFASLYEGFGLPILEAQAIGRPVITSTLNSMPEVAGDGACYVDPYQVEDIQKAVQRVMHDADYREILINNGYKNVERFRPNAVAGQYAALYRRIMDAS